VNFFLPGTFLPWGELRRKEHGMRKTTVLVLAATLAAATAVAGSRTLTATVSADAVDELGLDSGVGDVVLEAADGDTVDVEVILEPRRGGLFSSMKRAEREVESATLETAIDGRTLRLQIRSDSDDRRFEERWSVRLPARLAVRVDTGVGDVRIDGIEGGVRLDSGVGDVRITVPGGDIDVDSGVGDVEVRSSEAAYGRIRCSGGVGDAELRIGGTRISEDGFVGSDADWNGTGPGRIRIDTGVGDITVHLD
jgi:hypothetical protein